MSNIVWYNIVRYEPPPVWLFSAFIFIINSGLISPPHEDEISWISFYRKNTLISYRYHHMICRTHRKHSRNLKLARVGKVSRVAALPYVPRGKAFTFVSCLVLLTNYGNLKTYFSLASLCAAKCDYWTGL